ncbi:ABC transporter ATP-binding protein [Pelagicoccus albus]|uniref:ABC transporter ATP-binding protein n=1 Tax=Pelagicoccus albus TaxID=415222 RepID=A0A7X1B379_9BACT|nr:ABC transporter ATP-binding protein [Pelagicoccus albus]MBC2604569.1 ABC transporter ATP-binding protein [Pelagicoccus albus]
MIEDRYVELFDVVKAYPNPFGEAIKVVDGFNLLVKRGELVSVIGHSGCGKSTVLNMIAGLIPITSGGVVVAGNEVSGPGPDRAVVFQAPCLLPWMTCYGNVMLGVKQVYPEATKAERAQMVEYALGAVGLKDSMHRYPREMSGGMQQRVGIARAIALRPKMLLLDEPFGRLDSLTRMDLQDVILNILNVEKITTMMITHDPDEAVFMSDRICMMTNGPGAKVGEVMEIDFEHPRDRAEIMETAEFYEYRRRLLQFLDDCEKEKKARKKAKIV